MPQINVTSFSNIVETLENMVQGVKLYKDTPGFPDAITEEILQKMITDFKTKRDAYEEATASTVLTYNEYKSAAKFYNSEISRFRFMLYGFFGQKSPKVQSFGFRPYKGKTKPVKVEQNKTDQPAQENVA